MTTAPLMLAMTATLLAFALRHRAGGVLDIAARAAAAMPPLLASAESETWGRGRTQAVRAPSGAWHRSAALGPLIERAMAAAVRSAKPGQRHWQVDAALRRRVLAADPDALESALTALLRRAVVHSRDGDIISLRWVEATEMVAIVVEDEGDGLPGLGAQTDEAGMVTSLGVGLHHARSLAATQGGDVRLEAAPGIGARAWLTLPRDRLLETA